MEGAALIFVTLGATFLLALFAQELGRKTRLPRVTMLLLLGFLIGPGALDLLPEGVSSLFERASEIALTMVGFLLGERLMHSLSGGNGRVVLAISLSVVLVTAGVLFGGLLLAGLDPVTAILLAGIATATDPAATIDVVRQSKKKSKFIDILLGVVAVDDAWGLLFFSLLLAGAKMMTGESSGVMDSVMEGSWELGGAVLIGGILGALLSYVSRRWKEKETLMIESMGFVFLACGLALWMDVSFILTSMVMGAVVARYSRRERQPFHLIENVELPFMILFFTLAGASLDLAALGAIGWWGLAYVLLRALGRYLGGRLGARTAGVSAEFGQRVGLAMMPQAGVALGMALIAEQKIPGTGGVVMQIAIGSTVFFELVGPILTGLVIKSEKAEP